MRQAHIFIRPAPAVLPLCPVVKGVRAAVVLSGLAWLCVRGSDRVLVRTAKAPQCLI